MEPYRPAGTFAELAVYGVMMNKRGYSLRLDIGGISEHEIEY